MKVPVFYYHRVGPFADGAPRKLNVSPEAFREHMSVLARRARVLSLNEIADAVRSGRALPRNAAAVTFDDGYRDVMIHALPILKEFRIPATFFVVTDGVGGTDSWNDGIVPLQPLLGWRDLARLRDEGMSIGSHSCSHAILDALDEGRLRREIFESRHVLEERLRIPIRHFAYPQGRFSPTAEQFVREAGYDAGWATRRGRSPAAGNLTAIRRAPVSAFIRGRRFAFELWLMKWGLR